MAFILDASVALAFALPDETVSGAAEQLLRTDEAHVPVVWPLEVANVVLRNERRGLLDSEQAEETIQSLEDLIVTVDVGFAELPVARLVRLAREFQLTVYDAAYLELALRLGFPLASQDQQLRAAAVAAGIQVID